MLDPFWFAMCEHRQWSVEDEEGGIYRLKDISALSSYLFLSVGDLWHARFGHLNNEYLRQAFKKNMVLGLP